MTEDRSELYAYAFRETTNPSLIADRELVITDVNDALTAMMGYEREELIGSTPLLFFNDAEVYQDIAAALANEEPWVGDFEATTEDGRLVYGRGSVTPLVADGECEGYVASFTDMTRNRRYEESLRILNRVLRHNLRNDANVVLGHLERIADRVDDDALVTSLDIATARVEDMLDRARTTRRFSGILADTDAESLEPTDLVEVVERTVEDAAVDGAAVSVTTPRSSVEVLADDMLVPALQAVVENAIEHNDKPDPCVDISVTTRAADVVLSIADNGPGIEQYRRDRVLGREEQTNVEHGEGLSLFFVDQLMELYGGEISIRENDDTDGEGTVFDLRFRRPSGWAEAEAEAATGAADDGETVDESAIRTRAEDLAAGAIGRSVTAARLLGDPDGFPRVIDELDDDHPHHLVRLRRDDPIRREGTIDAPFRGDAAAVLTDDAVRLVVDGGAGGTWTLPYGDLVAVGRRDDELLLDTAAGRFYLRLPRSVDEEAIDAALAFLEARIDE